MRTTGPVLRAESSVLEAYLNVLRALAQDDGKQRCQSGYKSEYRARRNDQYLSSELHGHIDSIPFPFLWI